MFYKTLYFHLTFIAVFPEEKRLSLLLHLQILLNSGCTAHAINGILAFIRTVLIIYYLWVVFFVIIPTLQLHAKWLSHKN